MHKIIGFKSRSYFSRKVMKGEHEAALRRILSTLDFMEANGSVSEFTAMTRWKIRNFSRPLRDLLGELDLLDKYSLTIAGPDGNRIDTRPLLMVAIAKYYDSIHESNSWHSARWYSDQFGIPSSRLRQASRRKKLASLQDGKTKLYLLADVQKLWPEDTLLLRDKA